VISTVAVSSNLSPRIPKPDIPNFRRAHKVDFSTPLFSIGTSDFAISRIQLQCFRNFTLRNPEIACHLSASLTPMVPHPSLGLRDFTVRDITIPVARFTGLQSMKTRYRNPHVNPTTPYGLDLWSYSYELRTFQEYSSYLPCSSVRSTGSWDFVNPLQRILTVCSSSENSSSCVPTSLCLLTTFKALGFYLPLTPTKV
jgi:hypothetical protein